MENIQSQFQCSMFPMRQLPSIFEMNIKGGDDRDELAVYKFDHII